MCRLANLDMEGKIHPLNPNGEADLCNSWRHQPGAGESHEPDLLPGCDKSPQFYQGEPADPKTFLRSHIMHEDPLPPTPQVTSLSTMPMTSEASRKQCKHTSARRSCAWPCTRHVGVQGWSPTFSSNLGWQGRHCRLLQLVHIGGLFCLTHVIFWGSVFSPQSLVASTRRRINSSEKEQNHYCTHTNQIQRPGHIWDWFRKLFGSICGKNGRSNNTFL